MIIYNFPGLVKRNEVENYLTKLQQTNPVPKLQEVQIGAELSLQSTDNFKLTTTKEFFYHHFAVLFNIFMS